MQRRQKCVLAVGCVLFDPADAFQDVQYVVPFLFNELSERHRSPHRLGLAFQCTSIVKPKRIAASCQAGCVLL
jgi:hypothetical protein